MRSNNKKSRLTSSVCRSKILCLYKPRWGSMAASRLRPKVDVVWWSSSRVSRRSSWAARSMAALRHTGIDGTTAPRVWISSTVTTSYGFLNTCSSFTSHTRTIYHFNAASLQQNRVLWCVSPGCSTGPEHAKWKARCRRIQTAADSDWAHFGRDPAICSPAGPEEIRFTYDWFSDLIFSSG